jgi:hypothetical protein
MVKRLDHGVDNLLVLDGIRLFIGEHGEFEALFRATRVAASAGRPHGLSYSLVLLNAKGDRVIGFDNAHATNTGPGPGGEQAAHYDHKHVGNRIRAYRFIDSLTLIEDFWKEVDRYLRHHDGEN